MESEEYKSVCSVNESAGSVIKTKDFSTVDLKGKFEESGRSLGLEWDESVQKRLLSVYSLGYIIGNVSGGTFCALMGAKNYMALTMAITGLLQLLSPVAAEQGHWLLYLLRFLFGACVGILLKTLLQERFICKQPNRMFLSQGGLFCVGNALLPKWTPIQERSRASTLSSLSRYKSAHIHFFFIFS